MVVWGWVYNLIMMFGDHAAAATILDLDRTGPLSRAPNLDRMG
jgi:hypothetical protein